VPAVDADAAIAGKANLVREGVIAERLWLLGYLKKKHWVASSRLTRHREGFLAAVARFQRDAGLVVDRWSGEKTWDALQRLVTFESATPIERYCPGGRPGVALNRALRLRLWALGLLAQRPRPGDVHDRVPTTGLARFWAMWCQFDERAQVAAPPPRLTLISRVFDQDQLVANIAALQVQDIDPRNPPVFRRRVIAGEHGDASLLRTTGFLTAVAKIELWLLGFPIDIADQRECPVVGVPDSGGSANETLAAALVEFWDRLAGTGDGARAGDSAMRRRSRKRLGGAITPELFIALQDPERLGQLTSTSAPDTGAAVAGDYSREISDQLASDERVREAWTAGKRLGMKLWDGMRRLWRWIRRGVRALLRIGENLVRGFFRYAMKAFEIARLAASGVTRASRQYAGGRLHESADVHVRARKDGDIRVACREAADPDAASTAVRALRVFGASFLLACRILALFVRGLRLAVLGIFGWARFLWVLVRVYRDVRPLYRELRSLQGPEQQPA